MRQLIEEKGEVQAKSSRLFRRDACVHDIFEHQAFQTPNATAVVDGSQILTYQQLNDRANRVADYLCSVGVGPGSFVGIFADRSPEMFVGQLGVLKSGAAYVPLDPSYPPERLSFICKDAGIGTVLTSLAFRERWPVPEIQAICMEGVPLAQPRITPPAVTPDDLAYLMYTSGSSGTPKGVMIPHRGIVRLAFGLDFAKLDSSTITLHLAPPAFDASTFEIWGTLLHGGRCVIFPERIPTAARLGREIERYAVNTLWLTSSLFNAVVDEDAGVLRPIRQLLVGGEALSASHIRRALKTLPETQIINGYGPTENTTFTCCYPVPRELREDATSVPIGRPIGSTSVYILDERREPVAEGTAGELYTGGEGLARGYLNDDVLTAEKFIRNPFGAGRLYKTGDLVGALSDGNIDFLGRIDDQIKLRGYRIEPGEIENVLMTHPRIQRAAVLPQADSAGSEKQLVAFVVPRAEADSPEPQELRDFLTSKLPSHMVPSRFVSVGSLPLNGNGKIDRAALLKMDLPAHAAAPQPVLPLSSFERQVTQIWQEVLGVSHIGPEDNFFSLGGHSLRAVQVVSRMRSALGVSVPVRALFEKPTVAELTATFQSKVLPVGSSVNSTPGGSEPALRLSPAQEGHWFLNQLNPESAAYHVVRAFRFDGWLDRVVARKVLNEFIRRHHVLRTIYRLENGAPAQVVTERTTMPLTAIDLRGRNDVEEALVVLLDRERRIPFDLSRDLMLRALLMRTHERQHVLLLTMPHIASDGWSVEVLDREFYSLYRAYASGHTPDLPPLQLQYPEYADRQRAQLDRGELDGQGSYWSRKLRGYSSALNLAADPGSSVFSGLDGGEERIKLQPGTTRALRDFARKHDSTEFMLMLALVQLLLYRLTAQDDIGVGVPVAGRNDLDTEAMMGCFVNTLVLRTHFGDLITFAELLGRVRGTALEALAHQDYPFDQLVKDLNPPRNANRTPLFDVLLNFLPAPEKTASIGDLTIRPMELPIVYAVSPITIYADSTGEALDLRFSYQKARFSSARMKGFLEQFESLLDQIIQNPERDIRCYSLVTRHCRTWLPDPAISFEEPPQQLVTEMFQAWAGRAPALTAVSQGSQVWTYQQLADCVHDLTRTLSTLNLHAGDVIAVSGERSFGLIAGMLAVLESGCVLLLLDRSLPIRRASLMLRESSAKVMLRVGDLGALQTLEIAQAVSIDPLSGAAHCSAASSFREFEAPKPNDAAYLFFTSGSTGVPKGVIGCHKGLSHFLSWQRDTFSIGPGDRVAQLTNLSFDVVLRDIFLPLVSGATLCLPPEVSNPLAWIDQEQISVLHVVPTLAMSWLEGHSDRAQHDGPRWTFFAGEALTDGAISRWRAAFPGIGSQVNLYGPTETTLAKCFYVIPPEPVPGVQPIGRPLPQTQAQVINSAEQPCGIGEPGEIVLRTPFRALGYLGFPCDPATPYRTGDYGCYDPDGALRILGRIDDQIKIHGVRIEPQEIAAVLSSHPSIKNAFVKVRREHDAPIRLIAYVVLKAGQNLTLTELRPFLRERLMELMIPSDLVILDEMPLTPSGKVNRGALPAPLKAAPLEDRGSGVNPTEAQLMEIWQELLHVPSVGVHSNFFNLGGHSLLAARLMDRVERVFGVRIPVASLFAAPTIEALAAVLAEGSISKTEKYVKVMAGTERPFIFFHGDLFGGGLYCRKFARHLRQDHGFDGGFYAIPPLGWDGGAVPLTVEQTAAAQMQTLLEIQPNGPYALGGYCNGGLVAFELARILRSEGHQVDVVALVDATAHAASRSMHRLESVFRAAFRLEMDQLLESRIRLRKSLRELKAAGTGKAIALVVKKMRTALRIARRSKAAHIDGDPRLRAAQAFMPGPYSGRIVLFRSQDVDSGSDDSLGWRRVADAVDVYHVAGDHTTCLTKHVDTIAEKLTPYLL